MKIEPIFAWYDMWIGFFWDKKKRWLYIIPIPMIGLILKFKSKEVQIPQYVSLGKNGTELRLRGNIYYRDAGAWSIAYKIEKGKLFSNHNWTHASNEELFPITKEKWYAGNEAYVHFDFDEDNNEDSNELPF